MRRLTLAVAALFATIAVGAQTITIPAQTITITIPAQTVTLPAATTATPPATVAPTPAPTATSWVYHNGVFLWAGDWSGAGSTINYTDTAGNPTYRADISFKANSPYAFWLPYPPILAATGQPAFNTTGYNSLTFQIKSTVAGQKYSLGAYKYALVNGAFTSDISTGAGVSDITPYCTSLAVGAWATCNVPLSAIQAANLTTFYKFIFQDQSGLSGDVTYLQEIGFVP